MSSSDRPDETSDATGAVATDFTEMAVEEVTRRVDELRAVSDVWLIEWADGRERVTGLVGLAWYAREEDEDAVVSPVVDD